MSALAWVREAARVVAKNDDQRRAIEQYLSDAYEYGAAEMREEAARVCERGKWHHGPLAMATEIRALRPARPAPRPPRES